MVRSTSNVDEHMNENRRTPQNVMQTDPNGLVTDTTLVYAVSSLSTGEEMKLTYVRACVFHYYVCICIYIYIYIYIYIGKISLLSADRC